MKQFYKLAIVFAILPITFSAQYSQSFDSATMPSDWTVINGGDPGTWKTWTGYDSTFNSSHSGTHFLGLEYGSTAHSDYAISPAITITAGVSDKLTFWARNRGAGLVEQFDVKVSTTTPTEAAFTTNIVSALKPPTSWTQYTYDLTAYIGQTIYIAFYSNTTDVWFVGIDDFQVFGTNLKVSEANIKTASVYPNPIKDILNIDSKTKITEISIYDLSGKLYKRENFNTENTKVNVKDLPPGNYLLKIKEGVAEKSYKIIKE